MDRGQDQEPGRDRERDVERRRSRGSERRESGSPTRGRNAGPASRAGLRLGPGQQDRREGFGHRSPARVVWPVPRCYLPDGFRATGGPMPDTVTVLGKAAATTPRRPSCAVRRAGGRSCPRSSGGRRRCMRPSAAWCRRSRHAPMPRRWTLRGGGAGAGGTHAGDLDGIAVTAGPGLIGGVLSG
jgi:hypothetical protein